MADVFISYKRERRPAARHLQQILACYGYTVWFDLALVRGKDYEVQIERELNAAKAVIVLWCGLSVASEGVRSEASRAKADGKLIPLVIEPCKLPLFSTLDQNIDLTSAVCSPRDPALDPVLDDVERLVGRPPQADLKALRGYEATWRSMGAQSLACLPLEQIVTPETVLGEAKRGVGGPPPSPAGPAHDYGFWERQWERLRTGADLVALRAMAAEAPRYFADQARVRISEVEAEQRREAQERERKAREGEEAECLLPEQTGSAVTARRIAGGG
jgi:TIR domain